MSLHLNVPQHMGHHRTPPAEGEFRTPQYGPDWVQAMYLGADVRDGNIVTGAATPPEPEQ